MTLPELVSTLDRLGVRLDTPAPGRLIYRAEKGMLTSQLRAALRESKSALIEDVLRRARLYCVLNHGDPDPYRLEERLAIQAEGSLNGRLVEITPRVWIDLDDPVALDL